GQGQGAAVARDVAQLLAHHDPQGCHCVHACGPSPEPMTLTKASSRLDSPVCARSSSALPEATTWPLVMMAMRAHSADTYRMMCLDRLTQRPSSRRRNRSRGMERAVVTPSPLVASERMPLHESYTRARVLAVFVRWPREK